MIFYIYYTGDSISLHDKMTSFIKVIITCKNTNMLKMLQLAPLSTYKKIDCHLYEYCFTSLSAQSWQYRDRRKPEAGTRPYSYFK